jgi:Na+/phosphate symporter
MIDGISIIGLTPAGLLLIAVLMVLTGRLIPRAMYQEKVNEVAQWRTAYEAERTARALSDAQTRELLEMAKTSETFLAAVYETAQRKEIKSGDS